MEQGKSAEAGQVKTSTVVLLLLWFCSSAGAFAYLFISLSSRFDKPELLSATLGLLVWPYIVFVIALPATILLATNVRQLLSLQKAIDDAPKTIQKALDAAENLGNTLQLKFVELSNNLNGSFDGIEARMTDLEGRGQRLNPQAPAVGAQVLSPKERLAAHLESASKAFYDVLEVWNSDGSRDPQVVTRGGGNRNDIVEKLRTGNGFDKAAETNNAIAEYLKKVFFRQMSARRGGVDIENVDELDRLKQSAERCGAKFL